MRALLVLVVCAACGSNEPANEGKRMPQPPPIAKHELPADLKITILVDGVEKPPLTRESISAIAPDWTDASHKAWRIARLAGVPDALDTSFAITGTANNITVEFPSMSTANKLVPALSLSQRGSLVAEFVDPADPFPKFHGEGGRLGRSPESEPRVSGVTKIEVRKR